ncbi:hypothetical protein XENORESO_016593, partial [Xenotaenia resolanae]
FSALHEDIDSPRPDRRKKAACRSPVSEQEVPVVSAEELSTSLSSLHETSERYETGAAATELLKISQKEKLQMELETTNSSKHIYEEVTDPVHMGSFKQVSPFFTLYRTSPYNLCSQVIDPVYKGGAKLCTQVTPSPKPMFERHEDEGTVENEGVEGGEEWSLECLRTTFTGDSIDYLSRLALRETSNSSRTGVCEDRPLSMSDFGDSLSESEQAEQDFRKLSMELTEPDEVCEKGSPAQQPTNEQFSLPALAFTVRTECTRSKQTDTRGVDEVSHRLYKVLYGYDVESMNSEAQDVSVLSVSSSLQAVRKEEVQGAATLTKGSDEVSNSTVGADMHQVLISDLNVKSNRGMNQTLKETSQELPDPFVSCKKASDSVTQVSHSQGFEKELLHSMDFVSGIPDVVYGFEKMMTLRLKASPTELEAPEYESVPEIVSGLGSLLPDKLASPECAPDSVILLTESRACSPESVSSLNELNFLAPDSPVPQFRPLSPLPPPFLPWELGEDGTAAPRLKGSVLQLTSDAEERPLTPMVSNRRPFGRPVSPVSDYSSEQSMSPQSLTFDMEDRASSPESITAETTYWLYEPDHYDTHGFHEIRSLSPESVVSTAPCCWLPPDSPVQDFRKFPPEPFLCEGISSLPKPHSSQTEFEMVHVSDRSRSPELSAYVNEPKALSTDSAVSEFSHNWPDPTFQNTEHSSGSFESAGPHVKPGSLSPVPFNHEDRALSPSSVTSGDEFVSVGYSEGYTASSTKTTDFSHVTLASKPGDQAQESLLFDAENKAQTLTILGRENEDDWVIISLCDVEERPVSTDSVPEYRPMSPQSTLIDIRTHSPESDIVNECLSPDYPIPQYMSFVQHAVIGNDHSSSPESVLSDAEYEAMPLLSRFEDRPLSPESCCSVTDYGLLGHPETDQNLHKESALELTQAAVFQIDLSLNKFKTTRDVKFKREENPIRPVKENLPQTESLQADGTQSNQNIAPALEKSELLLTDGIKTELSPVLSGAKKSNEEVHGYVGEKAECVIKEKLMEIRKDQGDVPTETLVRTQTSDEPFLPSLSQQPTSEDLQLLVLSSKDKPEKFSAFGHSAKTEQPPIGYRLVYDAESWRLISQIHDPQYSGETFRNKAGKPQHYGALSDCNQEKSGEAVVDKTGALPSEMYRKSLSLASKAQSQPMSSELLMLLETVRSDSFLSGRSAGNHQALTPDSPISQFRTSFTGPSPLCVRSVSPESVLSDLEIQSGEKRFEDRPTSPDSASSVADSHVPSLGTFSSESFIRPMSDLSSSIESVSSDVEYGFVPLALLSSENRPLSVDSVDQDGPLSHESPIPELGQSLTKTYLTTWKISSSPVSLCSDAEYSSFSMESLYGDSRPPSIGSFVEDRSFSPESPIPEFEQIVLNYELSAQNRYSPVSVTSDIEYGFNSLAPLFNKSRSSSVDSVDENDPILPDSPIPEFSQVLLDRHVSTTLNSSVSPVSVDSDTQSSSVSLVSLLGESRPPSISSIDENGPLAPDSPIAEFGEIIVETDQFTLVDSAHESCPVSPDSPILEYGQNFQEIRVNTLQRSLSLSHSSDIRPSSPDSVLSGDYFRGDSPIPEFKSGFTELLSLTAHRFSSPEFVISDVEYASEAGTHISEHRTDSPESQASETTVRPQNQALSLQEIRVPVYRLVYDAELRKFISQIHDPQYVGETFFGKTGVFEYVGTRIEYVPEAPEIRLSKSDDNIKSSNVELESRSLCPLKMTTNDQTSDSPVPLKDLCLDSQVSRFPCDHLNISQSLLDSPTSAVSDEKSEHCMLTIFSESRLPSTCSALSVHDRSGSSPDSPLLNVRSVVSESVITSPGSRTSSTNSELSNVEYGFLTPVAFTEPRPDSCDSIVFSSEQNQSEDGPMPRVYQLNCQLYDSQYAGDVSGSRDALSDNIETCIGDVSLDLGTQNMGRPISPDSEHRSHSPEILHLTSAIKCDFQDKENSEDDNCQLSKDSPVPQFSVSHLEASDQYIQTSSHHYILNAKPEEFDVSEFHKPGQIIGEYRCSSPESGSVDIQDLSGFTPAEFSIQERLCSPNSVSSKTEMQPMSASPEVGCFSDVEHDSVIPEGELQTLSLDLTINQFKARLTERFPSFVEFRSSSPTSISSHMDYAPLISILGQTEGIPDTSESEAKLERRPLSPDSESECRTFSPVSLTLIFKSTSPESVGSPNKFRALSPDSPIPEFRKMIQESINRYLEHRSSSLESVSSDLDVETNWDMMFFEEQCPSPDSVLSGSNYQKLSPDSPVPDFRQFSLVTHVNEGGYRVSSPESSHSDLDFAPLFSQLLEDEVGERPNSPELNLSLHEYQHLSPDSPIPQYTHWEANTLTLVCESPGSVYSDEEIEVCNTWLIEDRGASPGLSTSEYDSRPDSPIPDFSQALQESFNRHFTLRSTSPTSLSSDEETNLESDMSIPCFFEGQAVSPGSTTSQDEFRPDSPVPEFTLNRARICHMSTMFPSSESFASYEDLETDLCMTWLFEDRATSPGSRTSKEEFAPLSPDSPIPAFSQTQEESIILLLASRSTSPETVYSDLEMELSSFVAIEDQALSSLSLTPQSQYRFLSPDSPVPDFAQEFYDTFYRINSNRSSLHESEASEMECAPLISQIFDFEDRVESSPSGHYTELGCLSPDSPLPEYPMASSSNLRFRYRSTSPESEFSDEDLRTDWCITWLFEDRAASPFSTTSKEELRLLSPDSPIPKFRHHDSTIPYELRSTSPESVFSDLEMPSQFPNLTDSRPCSPESLTSIRLSPDSPLPDLVQPMFELPKTIFRSRSMSPESTCSDVEYIVLSLGSILFDTRPCSPGSGASGDEIRVLPPDSPIPDYNKVVREHVIVNAGYRSPSPESIESDIEYALGELLIAMGFGVEDRPDSPLSIESHMHDGSSSVDSIAEYKPMSPDALTSLRNIRGGSPESGEESTRLPPDSPLPSFTQNVLETVIQERYTGASSPDSLLLDMEYDLVYSSFDIGLVDKRTLSPQSERSDIEYTPESPVLDFTKTVVEAAMTVMNNSSIDFSDSDEVSQTSVPFYTEERTDTPESMESGTKELLAPKSSLDETSDGTVSKTSEEPLTSDQSAINVGEYSLVYDAELWKLISQVRDPQYAGETFNSKTAFMHVIGSTNEYERSVTNNEQDNRIQNQNNKDESSMLKPSDVTHQFTSTETKNVMAERYLAESPPPMIEHILLSGTALYRKSKYMFQSPEARSLSYHLVSTSVSEKESDHLYSSLECLGPNLPKVEDARPKSINEFRPLSSDSPLPECSLALPECVTFLRSTSSSPETHASDTNYLQLNSESDFIEFRPPSPESAKYENQDKSQRPLSSLPLPEYRPVSFLPSMYIADQRASSPESVPEFVQNRSLSPDSPIPQFTPALQVYPTKHHVPCSSSESESTDSSDDIIMSDVNTNRPYSPESVSSISELGWLLPDSPVPEFMRILSSYFMDPTPFERSSSPVSLSSNSEFVALPVECWIDENPRPLSPASLGSENEFCSDDEILVLSSNVSPHTQTSSLQPEQFPQTKSPIMSPSLIQSVHQRSAKEHFCPDWQEITEFKYKTEILHGSEADEDVRKDFSPKPSPVKDVKQKETKIQHYGEELQSKPAPHRVRQRA